MIIGAHAIIYSKKAAADRRFLIDVFGFPSVDAGQGWLIMGLPPAELAVHPAEGNGAHEIYLMCEDVKALTATLKKRRIRCSPVRDHGWGLLTQVTLPGGGKLGVYQPRHPRPAAMRLPAPPRKRRTRKAA
jgi:hypothetical protein